MNSNATTNGSTDDRRYYEYRDCLDRSTADEHRAVCPKCEGSLQNIGIARE